MAMCEACMKIETGVRGKPGHDMLVETSKSKSNFGTGTVHYTKYVCSDCGTKWEYESDRHDDRAGWSVDT